MSSRVAARCAAIVCAGLFSACAVRNPLPDLPKDSLAAWRSDAGAKAAAGLQPDLDRWWRAFGDANLDRLVERALAENLGVKIAGERLRAARAVHRRSRSEFWPNLNFRVYEETAPGGQTGYLEMGFDSSWEFGFFGRAESTKRVNLADLDNAAIDEAAARVSLVAEVVRAYVDLCAANQRARMYFDIVSARQALVRLAEIRLRVHLGSQVDLDRATVELQQALMEASDAPTAANVAQQSLAVLLGATDLPDADVLAQAPQPQLPSLTIRETPADLPRTRPEIRRAEENVLRAAGELGIARADLYPKFSIVGTLISSTALTGDLDRPNKAVPLIGPAVTIPIFDWGARRDVVNAREAALSAAVLAYREAVLEGFGEVRSALTQFDAKTALVVHATDAFAAASRTRESSAKLRALGLADASDTISGDLGATQARMLVMSALRERALAYVALYKALGGAMPPARMEDAHARDEERTR